MSIDKKGTPEKINIVIVGESQFEKVYESITNENKLVKCTKCGKLLSKVSIDGSKTLQHRGLKVIIEQGEVMMKCTQCGTIIKI